MNMIRWMLCGLILSIFPYLSALAVTGNFFQIAESGIQETIDIVLCLNAFGPMTCQNYTVQHGVLDLTTVTPSYHYANAGIKLLTPGYTLTADQSGCTPIQNGYCIFAVNDRLPTTIVIIPNPLPPAKTARIGVSGSPLGLSHSGSHFAKANTNASGSLTVKNNSSTVEAFDIISDFTGTALDGHVIETGNTCQHVLPQQSCTLTFTPVGTAVSETHFLIQGTNTTPVTAVISVDEPGKAELAITVNPILSLVTNSSPGTMTIKNVSSAVTAHNIASNFTGTALNGNVTETGNTCATVTPGQSCTLTFTPGGTVVPQTAFPIQGSNTNTVTGNISISAPGVARLAVSNSPLLLSTNGQSGTLRITNLSTSVTATAIISNFTSTSLAGKVTETGNTCTSVAPGATCTLTYTPGSTAVAQTNFTIAGSNTNTVTAAIQIENTDIGIDYGGGVIGCMTSHGGVANLVATIPVETTTVPWAPTPLSVLGASSTTNGASNTSIIVSAIGNSPVYAAPRCVGYEVDSEGNTPCQAGFTCYNDWYLPAAEELECLYDNKNRIGGFGNKTFWSSTEVNKNAARAISFKNGSNPAVNKASYSYQIRCVRRFD